MRNRLLATLIVCVALLTQLGASFSGATAARDGFAGCHRPIVAWSAAERQSSGGNGIPAGAPAPHDHASCSLCQLGFTAISSETPATPARLEKAYWRVAYVAAESPRPHRR